MSNAEDMPGVLFVIVMILAVGALFGALVANDRTTRAWEIDAIRNQVGTYDEDTGKFKWIKPTTDLPTAEIND